ncbi:hypothetical protein PV343_07290 [Streptomyces sp. WI03-4A]|uniref:hypothetical protein n=1 Tax=Streptomyces sp. WI03-4A TaxID=3028706 RepID=UPI0029ADF50D|nr:hypothetical protein [Streptomyces sp. WI03-4A]MDX2592064.1 hypothetical protein [Streptomyces sp. WI03-4A]
MAGRSALAARPRTWLPLGAAVLSVVTGLSLPAMAAPPARAAAAPVSQTFTYTGAPQTLTVPAAATVTITADGAGGGSCEVSATGGTGARVVTTLPQTTASTTYTINVGGAGGHGCDGGTGGAGGYNGGGTGGSNTDNASNGAGGGGASSVSTGGALQAVAGGGGGGGSKHGPITGAPGGDGGVPSGAKGGDGSPTRTNAVGGLGGAGGTQSAFGTGGAGGGTLGGCTGTAGGNGTGSSGPTVGKGGNGGNDTGTCNSGSGGGGGGGYFGAGGGGASTAVTPGQASGAGGGGGSSFATGTGTTYAPSTIGTSDHNGQVTISYTVAPPSLTVTKTHRGTFTDGYQGTYSIRVSNNGPGPTDGSTVTVTDTLPPELVPASIGGTGWTCGQATLTCTRSDVLAVGSSYPPIVLTVYPDCRMYPRARNAARVRGGDSTVQVINTATVTGGGDGTTHTAADLTTLTCHEHHTPGDPRRAGHL